MFYFSLKLFGLTLTNVFLDTCSCDIFQVLCYGTLAKAHDMVYLSIEVAFGQLVFVIDIIILIGFLVNTVCALKYSSEGS